MISLAIYKSYSSLISIKSFHPLSTKEYLGAMAGFLTYFMSIIIVEVGGELRSEDWLSFLPGSFAEALRQKKSLKKDNLVDKVSFPL